MAEPLLELDAQNDQVPTYDLPIINGGVVDSTLTLQWGGPASASESIENITRPGTGNKWAEELWLEDSDAADVMLFDDTYDPDQTPGPRPTFRLSSDAVAFATKPRITVYDSTSHDSGVEEATAGTTNHPTPLVKARIQQNTDALTQYWGEASSAALHAKETVGAVESGNQGLDGDTSYLQCSNVNINTTPQYFTLALSVPDDISTGTPSIDVVLSVRYTYT